MKIKASFLSSIKVKLIIAMVTVAAVPLIVATAINFFSSTNKARETAKENLEWQAWYLQSQINNLYSRTESSLNTLATSSVIVDFLEGTGSETNAKFQLQVVNEEFGDSNQIVLSNMEGMMVLRSDDKKCVDISKREYWIGASQGNVTVSPVIVSNSTKKRSMSIAVPVYKPGTKTVIGVLHRSYDMNQIHEILAEDGSESFLVDKNGILAAHSMYEISGDDEPVDYSKSPYMTSDKESDVYESFVAGHNYVAYVKEPITGGTVAIATSYDGVVAQARLSSLTITILGLILLLIGGIFSYFLAVGFVKPIIAVDESLEHLASGEFNKIDKYTQRKDEFGQIVNNTNSVIDKLSSIVGHIKETSGNVGESSEELSEMADQIAATTETVASAIQQIAGGAVQQSEDIQSAAANTSTITDAVESVQGSTKEMKTLADRMKTASEESSSSLEKLQEASSEMTKKIEEISTRISSTQNAVSNINDRVEGISGIAAQTNLLSLNASIEAARAGDAGRGFAVVAEEIRTLADDSENLASEIRKLMDELLSEAEQAVKAADLVMTGNIEQQKALGETLKSVEGMLGDIKETVTSVAKIAGEADVCVSSNAVVSNAMTSLSAISEENAASTETTGASVEELSATVTTLAGSAAHLKDIALQLHDEIQFFK
ncbi:methyl-accepting chemotaxis protein [Lachnospiraceae bacterium]|nr:methyl-accepting chemotaxis protein [Lachnospiraceae bacterium]